ncbi:hypothetical protein VNO78_16700 [Psophocarpus tetragonolobus]|uniref:Uncharacterized protein n=1 Tax=Psophocarpus tetragonolobus TaxID=3891 RepID=A0AAN9SG12_PSOTE
MASMMLYGSTSYWSKPMKVCRLVWCFSFSFSTALFLEVRCILSKSSFLLQSSRKENQRNKRYMPQKNSDICIELIDVAEVSGISRVLLTYV